MAQRGVPQVLESVTLARAPSRRAMTLKLLVITGGLALVLLIACANVARTWC